METQHVHVVPKRTYFGVFFALLIGTALTVWAAFNDFGPWNTIVAVTIAVIKATLVILYFMHVRYSDWLIRIVVIAAFFWLGILLIITLSDYYARHWLPGFYPY